MKQPKQIVSRPAATERGESGWCWVEIRSSGINPSYKRCSKVCEGSFLTCSHHLRFELDARDLKWKYEHNRRRVEQFKQDFKVQHGREMTAEELKTSGL